MVLLKTQVHITSVLCHRVPHGTLGRDKPDNEAANVEPCAAARVYVLPKRCNACTTSFRQEPFREELQRSKAYFEARTYRTTRYSQ